MCLIWFVHVFDLIWFVQAAGVSRVRRALALRCHAAELRADAPLRDVWLQGRYDLRRGAHGLRVKGLGFRV